MSCHLAVINFLLVGYVLMEVLVIPLCFSALSGVIIYGSPNCQINYADLLLIVFFLN